MNNYREDRVRALIQKLFPSLQPRDQRRMFGMLGIKIDLARLDRALNKREVRVYREIAKKELQNAPISGRVSVEQINPVSGEVLAQFCSIREASDATGVGQGNISMCVKEQRKSAGGFYWQAIAPIKRCPSCEKVLLVKNNYKLRPNGYAYSLCIPCNKDAARRRYAKKMGRFDA